MTQSFHGDQFVPTAGPLGYFPLATGEVAGSITTYAYPVGSVMRVGGAGDGVSDERAAFVAAQTAASGGATQGEILVPKGVYAIGSNLTLTAPLKLHTGAILKPATGVTITLNGQLVQPGLTKHFDTSAAGSAVVFGATAVQKVSPRWWGAVADGATNDTVPWQAAINSLTGTAEFAMPQGTSALSLTAGYGLTVPSAFAIHFRGSFKYGSRFFYSGGAAADSIFRMDTPATRWDGYGFYDFSVNGNNLLKSVIDTSPGLIANSGWCSHLTVDRVLVTAHTGWAFRTNSSYSSRFNVEIFSGANGVACYGLAGNQNDIEINGSIYALSGIGVALGNGLGNRVNAAIEACAVTGLYFFDMSGLQARGYFERNGGTGFTFTSPAITKRADIIGSASTTYGVWDLSGVLEAIDIGRGVSSTPYNSAITTRANLTAYTAGLGIASRVDWSSGETVWDCTTSGTTGAAEPSIVGKVVGDTVVDGTVTWTLRSLTPGVDAFLVTNKGDNLSVEGVQLYEKKRYANLVEFYDPTGAAVVSPVSIRRNTKNTVHFSGVTGATAPSGAHWIESDSPGSRVNYMVQDFNQLAAQTGTTGTRIKSAVPFGMVGFGGAEFPTFDLTTGDTAWGPVINPVPDDLKDTWVYIGVWFKPSAPTGSNVQLSLSGNTDTSATAVVNQAWQYKSVAQVYGGSPTSIVATLKKLGTGSAVTIGPMILARVGDAARLFPAPNEVTLAAAAMPAAGSWKIGRRVVNSVPTIGQPKAWQRITTGSGNVLNTDWVSEGNL